MHNSDLCVMRRPGRHADARLAMQEGCTALPHELCSTFPPPLSGIHRSVILPLDSPQSSHNSSTSLVQATVTDTWCPDLSHPPFVLPPDVRSIFNEPIFPQPLPLSLTTQQRT